MFRSLDALPEFKASEALPIDRRLFAKTVLTPALSFVMCPQSAVAGNDSDATVANTQLSITINDSITNQNGNDKRPFAPINALVPATRVRIMIDDAVKVASQVVHDGGGSHDSQLFLMQLESLLLRPQNVTRGYDVGVLPKQPAQSYLDSYARRRNELPFLAQPGAALVQNGEIDTWKRLKRQERAREESDEYQVRAAFNWYTSNLNFNPDRYTLTGSRSERSRLIRDDQLPDVKNVIASDMGLRYLLRNEVLTALDDARAELRYQMGELDNGKKGLEVDGAELLEILQRAQISCSKWFDLIGDEDVAEAFDIVKNEATTKSKII